MIFENAVAGVFQDAGRHGLFGASKIFSQMSGSQA
jgi:hypothetical protein